MQEKIVAELGLNPVDKEVAVLYQGERQQFGDLDLNVIQAFCLCLNCSHIQIFFCFRIRE